MRQISLGINPSCSNRLHIQIISQPYSIHISMVPVHLLPTTYSTPWKVLGMYSFCMILNLHLYSSFLRVWSEVDADECCSIVPADTSLPTEVDT
jgi:hypothetical protein